MTDKLSMQDIIDKLSSQSDVPKEEAEKFIIFLFSTIELGLTSDELVKIKNFGTFKLTLIQERESIDVNTQEKILIQSHKRVSFVPAQPLKSLVNKPFAHFETTPLNDGIILDNVEQYNSLQDGDNEDEYTFEEIDSNIDNIQNNVEDTLTIIPSEANDESKNLENNSHVLLSDNEDDIYNEDKNNEPIIDDSTNGKTTLLEEVNKTTTLDAKPSNEKFKNTNTTSESDSKPKRSFLPWYIATAIFMIITVLFVYKFYRANVDYPTNKGLEISDITQQIKESSNTVVKDTKSNVAIDPIETIEIIQMVAGKTLRLVALDKYGSREFWVYIYLKNKDKIKNPDLVPVGIELVLPSKTEYNINTNNPESVSLAKKLGDEEMKKFW